MLTKRRRISRIAVVAAGSMLALPVYATTPIQVPEPGMLPLLLAGGIIGAVVVIRRRRK